MNFLQTLRSVGVSVEKELERLLGEKLLPGEITRPSRLRQAMAYSVLGGGKRLRPFLVIETARLLNVNGTYPLRAGAAVELVHCYSLVHDDLPAMDNDDLRRGQPTVHKAFNEATAILAGDGLLTFAFDILADPETHPSSQVRAALVLALARAAGLGGMVGGQALDLEAESSSQPLKAEQISQLQAMKTGALIAVAVEFGAILGGANAMQAHALRNYGTALGRAFQIADDVLDAAGDTAKLGKKAGKDAARNKATMVKAFGIEKARLLCQQQVTAALSALDSGQFGKNDQSLRETAHFVARRES